MAGWPPCRTAQYHPGPRELDDLELLTSGALHPTTRFNEPGSPVTLTLPADLAGEPEVELVDPEGLPLARVAADGSVTALTHAQHGPFRRLYLTPPRRASSTPAPPSCRSPTPSTRTSSPAWQRSRAGWCWSRWSATARRRCRASACCGPAWRRPHGSATPPWSPYPWRRTATPRPTTRWASGCSGAYADDDPVLGLTEDAGPDGAPLSDEIAAIVDFDRPRPGEQGVVLFFTGLSGSGKSTLAQAVMDRLLEEGSAPSPASTATSYAAT